MAKWKVVFDWKVDTEKVWATFYAEVDVWAESEDEAVKKARTRLAEKLDMELNVIDVYRLNPTLDMWMPGRHSLMYQLEELKRRGVNPELTDAGRMLLECDGRG